MVTIIEFYVSDGDRKNAIKQLEKFFKKKNSVKIEQGIYDYCEQYCMNNNNDPAIYHAVYIDHVKDLIYNCEQNKQTINDIKQKVLDGKQNEYNLAFLRPEELDRQNWEKIINRKLTTEDKINNLPTLTWKPCKNCKCDQYFFQQLQTRSADEPMTRYYECKECKRRYKINQ
jgi:DNA-directed RNA polymerase subunit M/transcription elongation factor TFIIS